jgi:hypothetical protein
MNTITLKRQSSRTTAIKEWLGRKNDFFSSILEETVSNGQVIKANYALIAFLLMVCTANIYQASFQHAVCFVILTINFAASVYSCKEGDE